MELFHNMNTTIYTTINKEVGLAVEKAIIGWQNFLTFSSVKPKSLIIGSSVIPFPLIIPSVVIYQKGIDLFTSFTKSARPILDKLARRLTRGVAGALVPMPTLP